MKKNMGNVWRRICVTIINFLPKPGRLQLTFFSSKMDYEPKTKLIRIDGQYYRFFDCNKYQDCELGEAENSQKGVEFNSSEQVFDVTDIKLFPHSDGKYKHSFYVPRVLLSLIAGPKGSTKEKIETETNTSILIPERKQDRDIVVIGSNGAEIISARHQIDLIAKESRYRVRCTHFMSIPMNHEHIIDNFNDFKTEVLTNSGKESRGVKENLFQIGKRLHFTLDVLWLFDDKEKQEATEVLNSCKKEIIEPFIEKNGPIIIEAKGVTCMNNDPSKVHILYAGIVDEDGHLQELSDKIVEYFVEQGLMKRKSEKVKMHMTVMNTLFSSLKERKRKGNDKFKRETFDASNIMKVHKDSSFGKINLSIIHLSQFNVDDSGYYEPTAKIDLQNPEYSKSDDIKN